MKLQTKQKIAEERETIIIVFLDLLLLPNIPNWKKKSLRNFAPWGSLCIYKISARSSQLYKKKNMETMIKILLEFGFMSRK